MLRKCCYCIELRKACIVISIIDFIFNIAILSIPDIFNNQIERAVAICHCIGCFFLLGGALMKATVLLIFYLITSLTNTVILTIYVIVLVVNEAMIRMTVVPVCSVYVCVEIYFWIVVYSYYVKVRTPAVVDEV
ncbi:uncharacterized protein [Drosophila kikkawai]|uniref:Uncharacterized protein isoform X1 n=1 Tax=Drosophila kikkawai TaxID=30033 RepID=A0A6P4JCB3_DROKI|nr:uncharacterized protein LOC108082353 isoform X1 [Drosophila kikkawai]